MENKGRCMKSVAGVSKSILQTSKAPCLFVPMVNLVRFPWRPFSILNIADGQGYGRVHSFVPHQAAWRWLEHSDVLHRDYGLGLTASDISAPCHLWLWGYLQTLKHQGKHKRMFNIDRISCTAFLAIWSCVCTCIHTCRYYYLSIYSFMCFLLFATPKMHTCTYTRFLLIIIIPWKLDTAECFDSIYLLSLRVNVAFISACCIPTAPIQRRGSRA